MNACLLFALLLLIRVLVDKYLLSDAEDRFPSRLFGFVRRHVLRNVMFVLKFPTALLAFEFGRNEAFVPLVSRQGAVSFVRPEAISTTESSLFCFHLHWTSPILII